MSCVYIPPYRAGGTVEAPCSKSDMHRLLIIKKLLGLDTQIVYSGSSEDVSATRECLAALDSERPQLYARESGSTLRFLLPVACALRENVHFDGAPGLRRRPIGDITECLRQNGVELSGDSLPLETRGRLRPGEYRISAAVSSQFASGLYMACLVTGGSVCLEGEVRSRPYIDLTLKRIEDMRKRPRQIECEGDWSNAANFLCLGALSEQGVTVTGLNLQSPQGDRRIPELLRSIGANVEGTCVRRGDLRAFSVDMGDIPDLIAPLAMVAAHCRGESVFYNAARLKYKESNRLESVAQLINGLGGRAYYTEDELRVQGTGLTGGRVSSYGDHRIAMAAALCNKGVWIEGAEAVAKSCPDYFERLEKICVSV